MNKSKYAGIFSFLGLTILLSSCTDDSFKEIKSNLLKDPNFETAVFDASVSVENIAKNRVQTNGLGGYLLGEYTQKPFGKKKASIIAQVQLPSVSPIFGDKAQSSENTDNKPEKETVTEAYLYLPYFNPYSTRSNTAYVTETEYALDSIYGNTKASFKVNVQELTYFLRDIDPAQNLAPQRYYSDFEVSNHLGTTLTNVNNAETVTISKKSITRNQFDNPTTPDDESKGVADVLAPGIRIALDPEFFQTKIISKEGTTELENQNNFKNHFRGIVIDADGFSDNLMMLLDMSKAKIELVYTYETESNNQKATLKKRYDMNVNGITFNTYTTEDESISLETDSNNISRIYLSGGIGQIANLKLFTDAELAEIRQRDVLITDASLYLYVDQSVTYGKEPERIFIYNAKTGAVIADYVNDPTSTLQSAEGSHLIHLGKLQKQNNKGNYYQIRLTTHVINIIKNKVENVPLAIAVASTVKNPYVVNYFDSANKKRVIPTTSVVTPLSTVIYGNDASIDDSKRLKLRINYSKLR